MDLSPNTATELKSYIIKKVLIFTNSAFKYRYECKHCSKNSPCKICFNVALNLYKIAFKYKDECKDCSAQTFLTKLALV